MSAKCRHRGQCDCGLDMSTPAGSLVLSSGRTVHLPADVEVTIGVLNALPARLAHERERRGLSLRDAAGQIGVGHVTLWQYEQGKRDVTVRKAVRLLIWLAS